MKDAKVVEIVRDIMDELKQSTGVMHTVADGQLRSRMFQQDVAFIQTIAHDSGQ